MKHNVTPFLFYLIPLLLVRTHYRGVIRKRLFPLVAVSQENTKDNVDHTSIFPFSFFPLYSTVQSIPSQSVLFTKDNQKTGKIFSSSYHVGIGSVRLEHLESNLEDTVLRTEDNVKFKVIKPHWWELYKTQVLDMEKKIVEQFKDEVQGKWDWLVAWLDSINGYCWCHLLSLISQSTK